MKNQWNLKGVALRFWRIFHIKCPTDSIRYNPFFGLLATQLVGKIQHMTATEFAIETPFASDHRSPQRWIWSHFIRHKILIFVMLIGAVGNAYGAALVPIFVGQAFDAVLEELPNLAKIGRVAGLLILSQAIRSVLQLGRNFASGVIGESLERDTREELYISLLGKSMTFHDLQSVGDTMARATNDVREINLLMNPGINLVIGSSNFMLMPLLLSPGYHPQLLLAPLFFFLSYIWALSRYLRALRPIADQTRVTFGAMNSRLAEAIDGIEMVKGTAQEEQEASLFRRLAGNYRNATVKQGYVEARFLPLLLFALTTALGFAHAILLFQAGELAVGDVIAYIGLLQLFGFPTFISQRAYAQLARGLAGARRILALLESETNLDENEAGYQGKIKGRIQFENVTFGYVDGVNVLEDVTFELEPGETLAIVGQTGAGKSTIAKLINRTYDPQQGRILVDGIDTRDWSLSSLRQQISIIEQDIFLFSRSVADNIAFGQPSATRQQVIDAAKKAQADDFIRSFIDGYDTVIGERGITLSGGQRQRLALARAFLTFPHILILDDSTSAVDSATEDQIQQAIANAAANQTTALITHRLSQIRWSDKILALRKGRVVGCGSHEELMNSSPAYRRIFTQYESERATA